MVIDRKKNEHNKQSSNSVWGSLYSLSNNTYKKDKNSILPAIVFFFFYQISWQNIIVSDIQTWLSEKRVNIWVHPSPINCCLSSINRKMLLNPLTTLTKIIWYINIKINHSENIYALFMSKEIIINLFKLLSSSWLFALHYLVVVASEHFQIIFQHH